MLGEVMHDLGYSGLRHAESSSHNVYLSLAVRGSGVFARWMVTGIEV